MEQREKTTIEKRLHNTVTILIITYMMGIVGFLTLMTFIFGFLFIDRVLGWWAILSLGMIYISHAAHEYYGVLENELLDRMQQSARQKETVSQPFVSNHVRGTLYISADVQELVLARLTRTSIRYIVKHFGNTPNTCFDVIGTGEGATLKVGFKALTKIDVTTIQAQMAAFMDVAQNKPGFTFSSVSYIKINDEKNPHTTIFDTTFTFSQTAYIEAVEELITEGLLRFEKSNDELSPAMVNNEEV